MSMRIRINQNSKYWKNEFKNAKNPEHIGWMFKKYWLLNTGRIVDPEEFYDECYILEVDDKYKNSKDDPLYIFTIKYDKNDNQQAGEEVIMQSDSYKELDLFRRLQLNYID